MVTQVFYSRLNEHRNVWCTTASDKYYSVHSRVHMISAVKPTARQLRKLQKLSNRKSHETI